MSREPNTAPAHVPARTRSWGGAPARAELRRIADEARRRTAFTVSAVEVLRSDGLLELVAFSGPPRGEAAVGEGFRLGLVERITALGTHFGRFVWLAEEDMPPDLQEQIRGYGYVPSLPVSSDPRQWRPLDILMAHITDSEGRTRALLHLDEPTDGLRRDPEEMGLLADQLELLCQAVLTTVDRDELSRHARLDETAREVVRTASQRLDREKFLVQVHPTLVSGFRARSLLVRLYDDTQIGGPDLPPDLVSALEETTRRAWDSRTVVVCEPDRVWGDDTLERDYCSALTAVLSEHEAEELLIVPVGAGYEPMGMVVVVRGDAEDRWTETESIAALGVGHDLGRALLSTRAHEREQQLIAELQYLDQRRRDLIATVTHELKNPLGVITGHVELLEQLDGLPSQARTSLRALHRSSARLSDLVQDLLLLSRIGNPETPLVKAPVDLVAVMRDVAEDEALHADHRSVRLEVVDPQCPAMVDGDPEELLRVLANVVSNAVKYSRDGGTVELALHRDGDEVVFICVDDGLGISVADQGRLFEEFFRSADPEARQRPGTGLGLPIVARIVERHGGRVEVESEFGVGTTVTVRLPAA